MNIVNSAADFLSSTLNRIAASPVVYHKANGMTQSVSASIGHTLFKADNDYGVTIRERSVDFLIAAAGFTHVPITGETITCDGHTYEVLAPNGEPCWEWSDNYFKILRIHTKEIPNV